MAPELLARVERDRQFVLLLLRSLLNDLRPKHARRALFRQLEQLLETTEATPITIDVNVAKPVQHKLFGSRSRKINLSAKSSLAPIPVSAALETELSRSEGFQTDYTNLVIAGIDINQHIQKLTGLLRVARIKELYVFLDDFSELPPAAMRTLVDTLIAPLNEAASRPIRFKIAAYPGQVYLGKIDRTKIDELEVDLDRLYGTVGGAASVEEQGADFIRRLLERRIDTYCPSRSIRDYFSGTGQRGFWRTLFLSSSGNPRVLGNLLDTAHESELLAKRRITSGVIEQAAEEYFRSRLWDGISRQERFQQMAHDERRSLHELLDLLESLWAASRRAAEHLSSETRDRSGSLPMSHFCIKESAADLLSTLELNFLVSRYGIVRGAMDSQRVVFAYNFGLCRQRGVLFDRLAKGVEYYLEPQFDLTSIADSIKSGGDLFICNKCGHTFPLSDAEVLTRYKMRCSECEGGICERRPLMVSTESVPPVAVSRQLTGSDLDILSELQYSSRPLRPKEIGDSIGWSYQLVTRRAQRLKERGLVSFEAGQPVAITPDASAEYFAITAMEREDQQPKGAGAVRPRPRKPALRPVGKE